MYFIVVVHAVGDIEASKCLNMVYRDHTANAIGLIVSKLA